MLELILFLIGSVGLIGGNLTVSKNSPVKGHRARMAGLILMVPLPLLLGILTVVNKLIVYQAVSPSMEAPILRWLELAPVAVGILGSVIYLNLTSPNKNPGALRFWLAATLPAIGLYIAIHLTDWFRALFNFGVRLPGPGPLKLETPDIVIGLLIPILLVFIVNLINPVVIDWGGAILFAIPVFLIHVYYFVLSDWIFPGISSIAYPGDTPGAGYQEIINGLLASLVSLLVLFSAALVGWLGAKTRRKLWRTAE